VKLFITIASLQPLPALLDTTMAMPFGRVSARMTSRQSEHYHARLPTFREVA
jgi:hypothetical protein